MSEHGYKGAIGIDFGTSFCSICVYENQKLIVIPNELGKFRIPSLVAFTKKGVLVGQRAADQQSWNISNTICDLKVMIGRRYDDPVIKQIQELRPFRIVEKKGERFSTPLIEVEHLRIRETYHVEEICALLFGHLKSLASHFLGTLVSKCVISVPACFNDSQRQAVKDACFIAGLNCLRLSPEPSLSAASYYHLNPFNDERNILLIDIGGGTCDTSIITVEEGIIEVKAVCGSSYLGGNVFDGRIMEYLRDVHQRRYKISVTEHPDAYERIRKASEKMKIALSTSTRASYEDVETVNDIKMDGVMSRAKFEQLNRDHFRKILQLTRQVMEDARLEKSEIHQILLIGGSSKIGNIQNLIKEYMDRPDLFITRPNINFDPKLSIAQGAALKGAILTGLRHGTPLDILFLNVIPYNLGIKLPGGNMGRLITMNTTIPCRKSQVFLNSENQTEIVMDVYEFEGNRNENRMIGRCRVFNLPPSPKNSLRVEVRFNIDANGIIHSSAFEPSLGRVWSISTKYEKGRLSSDEMDEMKKKWEFLNGRDESGNNEDLIERVCFINEGDMFFNEIQKKLLCTSIQFSDGKLFKNIFKSFL